MFNWISFSQRIQILWGLPLLSNEILQVACYLSSGFKISTKWEFSLFRTFLTSPKDHWVTSSVPPSTLWTHTQVLCSLILCLSFHFTFLQEIVFLCHHQLPYSTFWTHTPLWPLIFPFIKWHNRICSRNCVSCRHQVLHIFRTSTGRQVLQPRSSLNIEALVIIFV